MIVDLLWEREKIIEVKELAKIAGLLGVLLLEWGTLLVFDERNEV